MLKLAKLGQLTWAEMGSGEENKNTPIAKMNKEKESMSFFISLITSMILWALALYNYKSFFVSGQ